ncbi:50S ribosomal protein L10 [Caenispirillum bisanense]|uniref:Large ribosomal subunit protein uL10 n=1 Tax=Caenispirillum bisanense TaxID=414052 RepID=A0A286H1X4_9PROT|nr:50S ribosomal protein L10 [Caenispirillum bisanense]SOE01775.1 LSU ribosomal protein L10P [Caenispirillum bisanense]
MNRTEKQELVAELHALFAEKSSVVVTQYKGLTVKEVEALRGKVRDAGAGFKVTKNRLTRLALADTKFAGLTDLFTGPTAICFSDDPVAAAKATAEFAKTNDKLIILGGSMADGKVLDVEGVKALASLPSLDELRAKFLALIQTPATRIAGVTQAPAGQLARVFKAYADKGEAA